jgi:hypothetical protein
MKVVAKAWFRAYKEQSDEVLRGGRAEEWRRGAGSREQNVRSHASRAGHASPASRGRHSSQVTDLQDLQDYHDLNDIQDYKFRSLELIDN